MQYTLTHSPLIIIEQPLRRTPPVINKYPMQITHLNKYESLVDKHLHTSTYQQPFTLDYPPLPPQHLKEILDQIDSINVSRSYTAQHQHHPSVEQHPQHMKSNKSSAETEECDIADSRTCKSYRSKQSCKTNRSLIFAGQKFTKHKQGGKLHQIQIHYFDTPLSKSLSYDNTTRVSDLISQALTALLEDKQFDHSKLKQRNFECFQLRLLNSQTYFKADKTKPALPYDRKVCETLPDSLVLLNREQESNSVRSQVGGTAGKKPIVIYLYNELGEDLGCLDMSRNDLLQTIFEHIEVKELHCMRDYFLTEHKHDSDGLPRDFQVKNLQSNKIFIKTKKYIDDCQWQNKAKPIKQLVIGNRDTQSSICIPIGLTQASQYEQFSVIKVNSMGFQQERILGIDQTKIYNYDKSLRQEKRQTSFFSKFFGVNEETGTKRPFRMIKDILDLKKHQKGLEVVYKQKTINYIVKQAEMRDKIFRKLSFLVNFCKEQQSKNKLGRH